MEEWTPITERLPKEGSIVLVREKESGVVYRATWTNPYFNINDHQYSMACFNDWKTFRKENEYERLEAKIEELESAVALIEEYSAWIKIEKGCLIPTVNQRVIVLYDGVQYFADFDYHTAANGVDKIYSWLIYKRPGFLYYLDSELVTHWRQPVTMPTLQ